MSAQVSSYRIGLIPSKYVTNPDVPIKIVITVSGGGNVEKAKILVYSDTNVKIKLGEKQEEWSNVFIRIDKKAFIEEKEKFSNKLPDTFPLKGEFTDKINEVQIRSKDDGDHTVIFVLSYTLDDINWQSDRLEFKFHVNSMLDRNLWWWTLVGVIVALASLLQQAGFLNQLWLLIKKIFLIILSLLKSTSK